MEKYELEDNEIMVWVEWASKTYRGARDSLGGKAGMGPPIEPDDIESAAQIQKVEVMGIDITHIFDTSTYFGDEGQLDEHIGKVLKKILGTI
jgi:hypothetical protein